METGDRRFLFSVFIAMTLWILVANRVDLHSLKKKPYQMRENSFNETIPQDHAF